MLQRNLHVPNFLETLTMDKKKHLKMNSMGAYNDKDKVVVLMVPLPIQSHLNQLLQLACLVASYDLEVHYASSATHVNQVKHRFNHKSHLGNDKIHFHQLPTPPSSSSPPVVESDPSTKFPPDLLQSFLATLDFRQPVMELLTKLSNAARRVVVIHDILVTYAVQDIATIPNAESYCFSPVSAIATFFDGCQFMGKTILEEPEGLPSIEGCYPLQMLNFIAVQAELRDITAGWLFNTCRPIEETYIDLQTEVVMDDDQKLWAIGPLYLQIGEDKSSGKTHKLLEWLDKQDPGSVMYVSFGTAMTMTEEQIGELATGLEQAKLRFIWLLRDADKGDIFEGEEKRDLLPEGFEERVKEFGIVERDWAPQVEILEHPSVGGFMSHCGWNSCLESIAAGVPIAAWPMHTDQPKNAFFVTDILKIGLPVCRWEDREKLVASKTIVEIIKKLMVSQEGEEMRKRVTEIGVATREAVKEGGVSKTALNSFISHIIR